MSFSRPSSANVLVQDRQGHIAEQRSGLALTAAELRLLPVLVTHLTFREIAEQMSLSRTTIKSPAMSIYGKLGASSRSQAVARSRELGILEG